MAREINPFFVSGKIPHEYFCDRINESAKLIRLLTNGNNVVLISPRRMGKTGLIEFCYEDPRIADNYYTFFVDILHTSNLQEFTLAFGKEVFETVKKKGFDLVTRFVQALRSLNGKFGFDPVTAFPSFSISLGDITQPEYTLKEIFDYLDDLPRPCIVSIDEFQQLAKYPESNVEAILRSYIQKSRNVNFIFAGSERHIMQRMFGEATHPFYNSASTLELDAIKEDIYVPWVKGKFADSGRDIEDSDISRIYHMFIGHTYYVQKVFNEAFSLTGKGEKCSGQTLDNSIANILEEEEIKYRELLSNMPSKIKGLLYAIAAEGKATHITSSDFIRRHALNSSSAVQYAATQLLEKEIITRSGQSYSLNDKFFSLWLKRLMTIG